MSDIIIHHFNISYDESDERVVNFVKHLKYAEGELEGYYDKTIADKSGKIFVSDKDGNEFALVCNPGHNCALTLRGMENI